MRPCSDKYRPRHSTCVMRGCSGILAMTLLTVASTTAIAQAADGGRMRAPLTVQQSSRLPTLVLALGDDIKDVVARSTVSIATDGMLDMQLFDFNTPKSFVYNDPKLGFTLPEAAFFNMATSLGHVTNCQIGPHLGTLDLDRTFELLPKLISLFDNAGWQRDPAFKDTKIRRPDHLPTLRASFEKTSPILSRPLVEAWKNGDTELRIDLVVVREGNGAVASPKDAGYLVVVEVANRQLMREWDEKVMAWWRKDGVSGPRPLASVGKKKRP
jgi:hypothetical protein